MKTCSYCGAEYADDATTCPVDHTSLDQPDPPKPVLPASEGLRYEFPELSELDKQKDFVTLVSCANLPEADLIVSTLRAAGIEAFMPDESIMQIMPNTFGYVRVQVAPKDYDAAKNLLSEL